MQQKRIHIDMTLPLSADPAFDKALDLARTQRRPFGLRYPFDHLTTVLLSRIGCEVLIDRDRGVACVTPKLEQIGGRRG